MDGINRSGRKNVPNQKRCQGFSLIELSIALIIIGVVIVPVMKAYSVYRVQKARDDTYANLALIESAIGDYYLRFGHYPCPARRNIASNNVLYGVSVDCTPAALPATGTCIGGAGGVCRTTGSTTRPNPNSSMPGEPLTFPIAPDIMVGGVPFVTLGIPAEVALDGWSRTMTYAVTAGQANPTDADGNGIADNFDRYAGAIQVNTFESSDFQAGTATYVPATGFQNTHIFLASHGDDGAGAYTLDGALYSACDAGNADGANCDDNGVFFDPLASGEEFIGGGSLSGLFHHDDIVMEITEVPTGIWTYTRTNNQDAATFRRVGIGTDEASAILDSAGSNVLDGTGSPTFDNNIVLDVNKDISATTVRADEICDISGENCFPAAAIGGDPDNPERIKCAAGVSMTGIADGAATCQPRFPAGTNQDCPPGEYVYKITAGVISCR